MKSLAINVGANSNTPGGRGPIYEDASFEFVPILEKEDYVTEPTYADLGLTDIRPTTVHDEAAHFDPEFPEFEYGQNYTYGDRHSAKTGRIADLVEGDVLFFYATLDYESDVEPAYDWINTGWGAYIIGHFTLECDPIHETDIEHVPPSTLERVQSNAHFRRDPPDAKYIVLGDPEDSVLYQRPIPLSGETGAEPNQFVTVHSSDSGEGPWYRRVLEFDDQGTRTLLSLLDRGGHELDKPAPVEKTRVDVSSLGKKGQLQFFYHAPESELPVRDILHRNKTEPHIEERAENYCNTCYQNNIRGFLDNDDRRYLLLFTNCRNPDLTEHYDRRYIVGYIEKEHELDMGGHRAVQGKTHLVNFDDAVPLSDVASSPRYVRMKKFSPTTTRQIVNRLESAENVLENCLEEVRVLKEQRRAQEETQGVAPPKSSGTC